MNCNPSPPCFFREASRKTFVTVLAGTIEPILQCLRIGVLRVSAKSFGCNFTFGHWSPSRRTQYDCKWCNLSTFPVFHGFLLLLWRSTPAPNRSSINSLVDGSMSANRWQCENMHLMSHWWSLQCSQNSWLDLKTRSKSYLSENQPIRKSIDSNSNKKHAMSCCLYEQPFWSVLTF